MSGWVESFVYELGLRYRAWRRARRDRVTLTQFNKYLHAVKGRR